VGSIEINIDQAFDDSASPLAQALAEEFSIGLQRQLDSALEFSLQVREVRAGSIEIVLAMAVSAGIGKFIKGYPELRKGAICFFNDVSIISKLVSKAISKIYGAACKAIVKETEIRLMTEEEIQDQLIKDHGKVLRSKGG
jgi:hypothetical protein